MLAAFEKEVISLVGVCPTLEKAVYEPRGYKEEIIRCRDCDYVNDDPSCTHPRWRAGQTGVIVYPPVDPDGFCAWAERDA